MRKLLIVVAAVAIVVVAIVVAKGRAKDGDSTYGFGEVTRGDLENVVSATGTLSAGRDGGGGDAGVRHHAQGARGLQR